jgi:hypothetical protein
MTVASSQMKRLYSKLQTLGGSVAKFVGLSDN